MFEDLLAFRLFKLCHVMLIAGNRLGYENDAASESRDDKRPVACRLVFPGPQFAFARPGPARPQGAVYQCDRSLRRVRSLFRGRPVASVARAPAKSVIV